MKKCSEIKDKISAYLENELESNEKLAFEGHMNSCESCRSECEDIMHLIELCNGIQEVELPSGFRKELHEKLLNEKSDSRPKIVAFKTRYLGILASAAAVLLLAFLFRGYLTNGYFFPAQQGPLLKNATSSASGAKNAAYDSPAASGDAAGMQKAPDEANNAAPRITSSQDAAPQESGRSMGETDRTNPAGSETITNTNVSMSVASADPQAQIDKIAKMAEDKGGERSDAVMFGALATTETDSASVTVKVPSSQFQAFSDELKKVYGDSNIKQDNMEVTDQTALIDDLNNRLKEIDSRISELEKSSQPSEEKESLKQEREGIQTQLENIRFNSDYVFVNIKIQK